KMVEAGNTQSLYRTRTWRRRNDLVMIPEHSRQRTIDGTHRPCPDRCREVNGNGFRFKDASTVPVAGLYGNRLDAVVYRRSHPASGKPTRCLRCQDIDEPPDDNPDE